MPDASVAKAVDTASAPAASARSEALTGRTRLAFTANVFFTGAMGFLVAVYLGKFYIDVVLLPAGLFAIAVAVGRSLDALTDPVIGWVSDHTNTRWGRRKPWILLGVLCNAVVFYQMLTPPEGLSPRGVMWWFSVCYVTSFLCATIVHIPRLALGAELTLDAQERALLFGHFAFFAGLGVIFGAGATGILSGVMGQREFLRLEAGVFVIGYVVLNLWLLHAVEERAEYRGRGETPFVPGVRRALRNKPFVIMFLSHLITAIPTAIPASLVPFFVQYVIKSDEPDKWTPLFAVAFFLPGFLALPFWVWLARRKGKLFVWLLNGSIGVVGGGALFTCSEGDELRALVILCFVGLQATVWAFLGNAMHADVIDYDELHTGKRREAQFTSLWSIIPKFATIPGAAIPLAILGSVGYVPNEPNQRPEVVVTLHVLFALVPAAFNLIGVAIMWWYPLSEARHAKIREGVRKHERGEAAEDPITGALLLPPTTRGAGEEAAWYLDNFSVRELRAWSERGVPPILSVLAWTLGSLAVMTIAGAYALSRIEGFAEDPGALPTLSIVVVGLSLTVAIFHALRIRPALTMRFGRDLACRHLEALR